MSTTIERAPETPHFEGRGSATKGIIAFIKRNPVPTYYALAFAISWGGILLIVGPGGFLRTGATMPMVAGAALVAGPAVAGVLLTGFVDGRPGLRRLVARLRRWRVGGRWYAIALLTGPLVIGATVFGLSAAFASFRPSIGTAGDQLSIVTTGIALGLVGPFFEELGWTGFALPRLRRRYGVLATGLLMGLLWGGWHFPMFAGNTDPNGAVATVLVVGALLFAWLLPYRVLMVWVYDRTQSVLLAYLMHVPITATTYILAPSAGTSGIALAAPVLVYGAVFWLIVAIVAWANGGHLARQQDAATKEVVPV